MGFLVASSSTSSVVLRILIVLLLAALASAAAAAAAGGTIYKVGDDAGWIERSYNEDSLDVYYNVWSSTKKFYVGDTLLFVYDPNDWEGHNNVLQVTSTAYDTCADSYPIAVYTTGHDYVTLDHPGQYYFISHYGCLHGHNMLDIYVLPRPHDANNGNDFIPLAPAPAPTLAVSPSSSASSSPSPDHDDSISGTTTTTTSTPPPHSTSASASSSTSLLLGMLAAAAAAMVVYLG